MDLYQHQIKFLKENPDKTTLVWSCGTGKTRAAIEWANLWAQKHDSLVLIICPKALEANWHREVDKWGKSFMVQIATKEEFRKNWNSSTKDPFLIFKADQVIVDEVHNGFLTPLFKSQMSKALRDYLKKHNVPRVLLLSATVYTSSPWNIFNMAHFTGHKWNWRRFRDEFFYEVQMGFRRIPMVKKGSEAKLATLTKKIASVVDIADCMDVPLQNHLEPEYFKLTKEQEKAIKDNYDPLPIVRYTAQHEIENGVLLPNQFRVHQVFANDKIERIKQICEENKKVAIVCRYNAQIEELQYQLEKCEKNVFVIRGSSKNRDQITLDAEACEYAIVLIQADCAEGYQLPSFELCVFASQSYSYTKWEQICGRFLRMDKPSRTTFVYLLTQGDSIDQAVYDSVKRKEDFKIQLYK